MVSSTVGKDVRRLGVDFAIASISGYQKYLSPYKGFACAHRVFYGGESCSQYVKRMLGEVGFSEAVKASHQRFADCREANQILKASQNANKNKNKRRQADNKNFSCNDAYDLAECGCDGLDCLSNSNCDLGDCGNSDCCGNSDSCGSCDCCGSSDSCGNSDCCFF